VLVLVSLRERPSSSAPSRPSGSVVAVLGEPLVWSLGAAYFCLKLIRYSLLFWLPFFLHRQLGYEPSAAGYLSISFELGGAAGAVTIGYLSDRVGGRRGALLVAMTTGLALALALYGRVAALGAWVNFGAMSLVGFLLFGPDALVSSVAAQDLGGVDAAGTAAGVINGVGSVGAIAQGTLIAVVVASWGWSAVFEVFIGLALVSSVALIPYALARRTGARPELERAQR
jgi:sugar phosphate permease